MGSILFSFIFFLLTAEPRTSVDLSGTDWYLWLDQEAPFLEDPLFLPPVDLATLPVNPPTCGFEALYREDRLPVSVPGTVEAYCWDELGDYQGVSWWYRRFTFPSCEEGQRVKLHFDSARMRCEVFLNEVLVGYDLVGNTPFSLDISDFLAADGENRLALRITDPSGNFDWADYDCHYWGKQPIPASHGFGGVTGRVRIERVNEVHVRDLQILNRPVPTQGEARITVLNESDRPWQGSLTAGIHKSYPAPHPAALWQGGLQDLEIPPGETTLSLSFAAPEAELWDLKTPNLYRFSVNLSQDPGLPGDAVDQVFGFRWFCVDPSGEDVCFRLNHRRVVLRSAISWGFWPVNGIFPTPELAARHVVSAQRLGLNMLNIHRCIGRPLVFQEADRRGLLLHEEPGGYTAKYGDDFSRALAREKLLRMIKRDRNHPSLVIYNMINEQGDTPTEDHKRDMRDSHALDPSRTITYVSGWSKDGEEPEKLHMLPYDEEQRLFGWYDYHHAPGPGVYRDRYYNSPGDYYLRTDNQREIVFYGEDGAITAPPRLEKIAAFFHQDEPRGWDGTDYLSWYQAYDSYLKEKKWRPFFPSIDDLCLSLGAIPYYYQGRIIENIRIDNRVDGYVINGYEGQTQENHSGVVDCFRNPKGPVALLAHYNQPLYVAIKARELIAAPGEKAVLDLYLVNEVNQSGPAALHLSVLPPSGAEFSLGLPIPLEITGGDCFGQLLAEAIELPLERGAGRYLVRARLLDADEQLITRGREELFVIDWQAPEISSRGAVFEKDGRVAEFLKKTKGIDLPRYNAQTGPLDYLIIAQALTPPLSPIDPRDWRQPGSEDQGLTLEIFQGQEFNRLLETRTVSGVAGRFKNDPLEENFKKEPHSFRWTGRLTPKRTGEHIFVTESTNGIRLWVDDRQLIDHWTQHTRATDHATVHLEKGRPVNLRLDCYYDKGPFTLSLRWALPVIERINRNQVLGRVRDQGMTLFVFQGAEEWLAKMAERGCITLHGTLPLGRSWLGGSYFVRSHPFLRGLPMNQAMNWEYQYLADYQNPQRYGLILEEDKPVVACVTGHEHQVATAMGVIPLGKGKVVFSTLNIIPGLAAEERAAHVSKAIFLNCLATVKSGK